MKPKLLYAKEKIDYQHCNVTPVDQNVDRKHHNIEHHRVNLEMVPAHLVHHDQATQNLTNGLYDASLLSQINATTQQINASFKLI